MGGQNAYDLKGGRGRQKNRKMQKSELTPHRGLDIKSIGVRVRVWLSGRPDCSID